MTSQSRITFALHKLLLRTAPTPAGRLWALAYRLTARAYVAYLLAGQRGGDAYLRGSLESEDFLPGVSDIDLVVVVVPDPADPGAAGTRVRGRWERLRRAFPAADLVLDYPLIYEDQELDEIAGSSAYTYGLDDPVGMRAGRSAYFGADSTPDTIRTLERPDLYGTYADWKPLRGGESRPVDRMGDAQDRRIAAWLELQHWWRFAFPVCVDPTGPRTASLCVKLVAEPARILLLLAHGELASSREDVLQRALLRLPEEEEVLRSALDLRASLPESPEPPLEQCVGALLRFSERIAGLIAEEIAGDGVTEVGLAGVNPPELIVADGPWHPLDSLPGGHDPPQFPLCDWWELTRPDHPELARPDRTLAVLRGDPGDPAVLAAAAPSRQPGPKPALVADGLMVLPSTTRFFSRLCAIKCPPTDPVSFALVGDGRVARFPNVRGWSVRDTARRAVAEHRARLQADPGPHWPANSGEALSLLLTAARAALLWETITEGEPQLAVTVTETAQQLAARSTSARTVAEDALEHYRAFAMERTSPPPATVAELHRVVRQLPAFGPSGLRSSDGHRRAMRC